LGILNTFKECILANHLKKLSEWKDAGFLDEGVYERILAYEKTAQKPQWMLYGLVTLGVGSVALGIIATIAANWAHIADGVKLSVNFLGLSVVGGTAYWADIKKKKLLSEGALFLFFLWCIASIGLISQIYHLSGDLYQPLFLWTGLTLGVACLTRTLVIPLFWVGALSLAATSLYYNTPFQKSLGWATFGISLPFVLAIVGFSLQMFCKNLPLTRAFLLGALIISMGCEIILYMEGIFSHTVKGVPLIRFGLAGTLGLLILVHPLYQKGQKAWLFAGIAFFMVTVECSLLQHGDIFWRVMILILGLGFLMSMAIFLASTGSKFLFQTVILLAGLRLVLFYISLVSGLETMGLSLILTGLFIVAMVLLWKKHKDRLFVTMKEISS
jgi:uncharacterized membrane protein